jgi:hypothetical protein
VVRHGRADRELRKNGDAALEDRCRVGGPHQGPAVTKSQIHLVAWTLVMVVQVAHGHIAEWRVSRGPNDPPPRRQYPWIVHVLVAGAIAAAIGYLADVFGWVQE